MYEYADAQIRRLNKIFIREFTNVKTVNHDELNVIRYVKDMYKRMDKTTRNAFIKIARNKYPDLTIDEALFILYEYDQITKYVYDHEVERKAARFTEAFIATKGNATETKKALRLWADMIKQYSISITDYAQIERYKADGIKHIVWMTEDDERVCAECISRGNKKYHIDKIPTKPHYGCRCYFIPAKDINREGDALD